MEKYIKLVGIYTGEGFVIDSKMLAQGTSKKVFLTKDRKHVVAIYKKDLVANSIDRIKDLVETYRASLYNNAGKDYWDKVLAWPVDLIQTSKGKWGIVVPYIPDQFRFQNGDIKGEEKKGNWFIFKKAISIVPEPDKGNFRSFLIASLHIARITRRMHSMGLTHSDLSYNNVLVDPQTGLVKVMDIDSLMVPGKYPPEVLGTPGFIAPEVVKGTVKNTNGKNASLPCRETDLHALSVLIYQYLFKRHPLKGKKVWNKDAVVDDLLQQGENALFIENSKDNSNRIKDMQEFRPWSDTRKLPYTIAGPFLAELFKKAFEEGLHKPNARPLASEWESALIKTLDRLVPCKNKKCKQKWFVLNKNGFCPFCETKLKGKWPIVDLHKFDPRKKEFVFEKKQIIPYHGKKLYLWHTNSKTSMNEKLSISEQKSQAYFQFHKGSWYIVNERIKGLHLLNNTKNGRKYYKIDKDLKLVMGKKDDTRCMIFKTIEF